VKHGANDFIRGNADLFIIGAVLGVERVKRLTLIGIITGGIVIAVGLLLFGTTIGKTGAQEVRIAGLLLVSFGAMGVAIPLYVDARRLQSANQRAVAQASQRRGTSQCALCGLDTASFWCTSHTVRLCPDCVPKHHDPARCLYKPLMRVPARKNT
jgi:hypothetical protein